jgi:hypothetical protein
MNVRLKIRYWRDTEGCGKTVADSAFRFALVRKGYYVSRGSRVSNRVLKLIAEATRPIGYGFLRQ